MATQSEIKVKRLISLFEPITESQPEEKHRRASLQNITQQRVEMCPKENSSTNDVAVQHVVRVSLEMPPNKGKATDDKAEITEQQSTDVFSGDMSKPKHLEKPKRLKDLKELLKISTDENDRLRSELHTLTKKLESVENAFETFKKEHKLQVEESVKHEVSDETTKSVKNSNTDRDELKSVQEELATEKQVRTVVEKRLKMANAKILDLIKKLKEKDKELLVYKTNRDDLEKAQEDQKEDRRIHSELTGQLSEANEKTPKPIHQLDAIANKNSEFDVNQKRQSKPDTNLEIRDRDIQLLTRQVQGRKKLQRPNIRTVLQVKSLDFDNEIQLEADLEQHASNSRKETLDSGSECSLPFPEPTEVSQPIPNLYSGFNRPKRQKSHAARSSFGSLAKRDEEIVVAYV